MLDLLSIFAGVLKLAQFIAGQLERKQLINAGEAKAINANLSQTVERVERVKRARADAANRERVRDKFTRPDK